MIVNLGPDFVMWHCLGQKIVDQFTKLTEIDFSMKCFTADFWRVSSTNIKNCFLGSRLGTLHQIEEFQGFS